MCVQVLFLLDELSEDKVADHNGHQRVRRRAVEAHTWHALRMMQVIDEDGIVICDDDDEDEDEEE